MAFGVSLSNTCKSETKLCWSYLSNDCALNISTPVLVGHYPTQWWYKVNKMHSLSSENLKFNEGKFKNLLIYHI